MKQITKYCTECGACKLNCPKQAIKFQFDGLFNCAMIDEKKCIGCGKCLKICPSNKNKESNDITIKIARLKDNQDIMKSTSGGLFGECARLVLGMEGVVYGAAFSADFKKVSHIRCDSLDALQPILRSKYLRSDLQDTFKQAEEDLKKDKIVLYSGTPCQIAGLKAYLKKDYDNLYTTDIICHGTPSPKIWKKYVEYLEKKEKSELIKVDFRYFNSEDPSKNLYLEFKNGKIINDVLYNDAYGRAFSIGLINGDCCGHCAFNDFRNYSDLTLGDAWGYKNEKYPHKNSLIFINTEKGKELYYRIKDHLIEFNDFDFEEMLTYCYPILHPTLNHYNYGKVDSNAKNIEKELWYWLDEKNGLEKDELGVGILNFSYENINFGANLVAYSLSKAVEKLGYHPHNIDFDIFDDPDTIRKYQSLNFYKFRDKYLHMTPKFKTKDELGILNDYYDMYITGSDQVWRKYITRDNYSTYFLDFVKNKNKISYGASFGSEEYDGDVEDLLKAISNVSSFYGISLRENKGLDICKNYLKRDDAEVVLDPTLLLTAEEYEQIDDDLYDEKIDVAVYLMLDAANKKFYDKQFKRLFPNKKIVNIKGDFVHKPFGDVFVYNHISKWMDGIRKSEYVVTDSYHGLIFGLIFHKNVICLGNNSSSYSRFATLIENLGGNIDKIMFSTLKDVKTLNSVKNVLNYNEIDENIVKLRKKSIAFLKNNLGKSNIKEGDNLYAEIGDLITELKEENKKLEGTKEELDSILNSRSWKFTEPLRIVKGRINKWRRK